MSRTVISDRLLCWLALLVAMVVMTGCTPLVRQRTLPPSIRAVYVPMAINRSAEPGLEEQLTVAIQREILADGRLNMVRQKEADAIVQVTIIDADRVPTGLDGDDFAVDQMLRVTAHLQIQENLPGRPSIGGIRRIVLQQSFNADTRSIGYTPEPSIMAGFYNGAARQIVQELMTGDYTGATANEDLDPTVAPQPAPITLIGQ